jgi:AcrR family transcriptional regulator
MSAKPSIRQAGSRQVGPRERITTGALALFNERGVGRVTTAEIAEAARMREGNLHYHFPRKEMLIEALFDQFQAAALRVAEHPLDDGLKGDPYQRYQRTWFELMWEYRCFYRDGTEMLELAPRLVDRVRDLRIETQARARTIFERAITAGLMKIDRDGLTRLLDNVWIVSSHWMSYRILGTSELAEADLEWGFAQVRALYEPYLVPL